MRKREKKTKTAGHCCVVGIDCYYVGDSTDLDHIKTFGSGGSNAPHNLMPLCRWHHIQRHKIGITRMAKKFYRYRSWLSRMGWYQLGGKWVNDSERH